MVRAAAARSATSGGSGSCALDLCAVAAGRLDAYVEEGLNLWDHAAGGLVATEAGARVEVHPGARRHATSWCAPRRTVSTSSATLVRGAGSWRRIARTADAGIAAAVA